MTEFSKFIEFLAQFPSSYRFSCDEVNVLAVFNNKGQYVGEIVCDQLRFTQLPGTVATKLGNKILSIEMK